MRGCVDGGICVIAATMLALIGSALGWLKRR